MELPELKKQNDSLDKALSLKDKEIELLRKEINQAKKIRKDKLSKLDHKTQDGPRFKGYDSPKRQKECNIMKNRLLLATTHEYENAVNELRAIAMSYPGGMPQDDDVEAQRRIAPILYKFVDMAQADTESLCIRSLLAASLAYLSMYGMHPDIKDSVLKIVRSLNLTSVQEMKVMGIRDKLMGDLKLLYDERKDLNQRIQNGFMKASPSGQDISGMFDESMVAQTGQGMSSLLVADVDDLKKNLLCECQLRQNCQVAFFRLLQPIQCLKIILACEPRFPDLIAISNGIAEQVEMDSRDTLSFTAPLTQPSESQHADQPMY